MSESREAVSREAVIRVEKVWKSFDGRAVLRSIDLDVHRHEVVVLIGASGSGKSTLLRCINALETVDAGAIWLNGELDVTAMGADVDAVRRRVGIVFQSFNLFPHLTVLQNVTLAPRKVLGVDEARARTDAMTLLERFGLAGKAREYPDLLSGGQAQRVAIIRALAMDPEVMLFDEITSALDPLLVTEVLETVRQLKADGLTIVMATHEMSFARDVADTICFLKDGRILEQGSPDELFTNPQQIETRNFLARVQREN